MKRPKFLQSESLAHFRSSLSSSLASVSHILSDFGPTFTKLLDYYWIFSQLSLSYYWLLIGSGLSLAYLEGKSVEEYPEIVEEGKRHDHAPVVA